MSQTFQEVYNEVISRDYHEGPAKLLAFGLCLCRAAKHPEVDSDFARGMTTAFAIMERVLTTGCSEGFESLMPPPESEAAK